tara:strand:+ start:374 stop:1357 length:984 start_codon:yes stop_codon:yes gene_type:complete
MNELHIHKYISKFYKKNIKIVTKIKKNEYPNIILYGIDKFQQYYFIKKYLKKTYDIDENDIVENKYKITNIKQFDFRLSQYHYELDINKKNYLLVHNIIDFIKDNTNNSIFNNIKYIVLLHIDELPQNIQWALRSIIEKTYTTTRYILTCKSINNVEKPILSRMFNIRLPALTNKEIHKIMTYICKKEKYTITKDNINIIIKKANRDITRAVLILQASFSSGKYVEFTDYIEIYINKIISHIIFFKKTESLLKIRKLIFSMRQVNIDINYTFKSILQKMIEIDIDVTLKSKIISQIADAQYKSVCGDRSLIHLEYCIISIINLLHNT